MKFLSAALVALATSTSVTFASPILAAQDSLVARNNDGKGPVVDLGAGGKYRGVIQNGGKVESWKGIPYAAPPVGDLRFKAPRPLSKQSSEIQDVTVDALRCVQFTRSPANIVGARAGPGQEDCLKLWVWKPASAKEGDKLPVMVYTHGGGLQFSAAPNNDFSDWVSQDEGFIAVNMGYRLGAFGFLASSELLEEGEHGNAAFLDQRAAYAWVKKYIHKFGGDGDKITIMGQSGGAQAVLSQLALYDGKDVPFRAAVPRSSGQADSRTFEEHKAREAYLAEQLGCSSGQSQLECFRAATPDQFVDAAIATTGAEDENGVGLFGGYTATIDGYTLTDTTTNLFRSGKVAKVPIIVGSVTHEGNGFAEGPVQDPAFFASLGLTSEQAEKAASLYPVNDTFADFTGQGNFWVNNDRAAISAGGENGYHCTFRLLGGAYQANGWDKVWASRFEAPTVATKYAADAPYPLAPVLHSADNSYLQNATSVMTEFEKPVAYEWRAFISSFIKTLDPNTHRLKSAKPWLPYGAAGEEHQLRYVTRFQFDSNAAEDAPTGSQMEIANRPQIERCDFWQSEGVIAQLHK